MITMNLSTISVTTIDGNVEILEKYQGRLLLIVNVASKCGFTGQYAGLEALYQRYRSRGFVVLGFPCNQFARQEPGDNAEIERFCSLTYNVTFPLFAKIEVNGSGTHPLYRYLKKARPGFLGSQAIKWNFTKFLVAPDGTVLKRYGPAVTPEKIGDDVEKITASSSSGSSAEP